MKTRKIQTTNREIYEKFNLLHFSPEVILENCTDRNLGKLIKNINKNIKMVEVSKIGNLIIVKKKFPIDFSIYLMK